MSIARLMQMARAGVPAGDVWTDPDLANASYDSVSFSVAGEETTPTGLFFKPDGTKLYVIGSTGDDVNEYDLSAAWDVSTASYVQNFSVASQDTNPRDLFFKPDGLKMYVVGYSVSESVHEYSLSVAWDISTASYVQNFSVGSQDASPNDLFFKSDGLKMYMCGTTNDNVYEYSLSSAWDVSTASYIQSFSVATQESTPSGLFFNPDGSNMYVVGLGGDAVNEYSLSSAWDISTASYVQNFSVASQDVGPQGLFFKSDGSKMYILGIVTDTIYQYSTA